MVKNAFPYQNHTLLNRTINLLQITNLLRRVWTYLVSKYTQIWNKKIEISDIQIVQIKSPIICTVHKYVSFFRYQKDLYCWKHTYVCNHKTQEKPKTEKIVNWNINFMHKKEKCSFYDETVVAKWRAKRKKENFCWKISFSRLFEFLYPPWGQEEF